MQERSTFSAYASFRAVLVFALMIGFWAKIPGVSPIDGGAAIGRNRLAAGIDELFIGIVCLFIFCILGHNSGGDATFTSLFEASNMHMPPSGCC
jgi:hypothetical protein